MVSLSKYGRTQSLTLVWGDGNVSHVDPKWGSVDQLWLTNVLRLQKSARRRKSLTDVLLHGYVSTFGLVWNNVTADGKLTDARTEPCFDCGQEKVRKLSEHTQSVYSPEEKHSVDVPLYLKDHYERHVCTPREKPIDGVTYRATYRHGSGYGLIGSYSTEIRAANGAIIGGLMSSRESCEKQLRIWGFKPPYSWTPR